MIVSEVMPPAKALEATVTLSFQELFSFGLHQERIRRHVLDEVFGDVGRAAATPERVENERNPASRGGEPGDDHEACFEAQRPQRNQQV